MSSDKFSYEEFEKMVNKFFTNKNQLGFTCSCTYETKDETSRLFFNVENIQDKFQKAVKKLMFEISQAATYFFMSNMNARSYADPDEYDKEEQKCAEIIKKNLQNVLNILFDKGMNSFVGIVSSFYQIAKLQYELGKMRLSDDGRWHISPEYFWDNGVWNNGQEVYTDFSCTALLNILN